METALSSNTALIVYDVFLTHELEIGLIWRRRFSGVTILYFLNRYLYILSNVLSIVQLWSERSREVRLLVYFSYLVLLVDPHARLRGKLESNLEKHFVHEFCSCLSYLYVNNFVQIAMLLSNTGMSCHDSLATP